MLTTNKKYIQKLSLSLKKKKKGSMKNTHLSILSVTLELELYLVTQGRFVPIQQLFNLNTKWHQLYARHKHVMIMSKPRAKTNVCECMNHVLGTRISPQLHCGDKKTKTCHHRVNHSFHWVKTFRLISGQAWRKHM